MLYPPLTPVASLNHCIPFLPEETNKNRHRTVEDRKAGRAGPKEQLKPGREEEGCLKSPYISALYEP